MKKLLYIFLGLSLMFACSDDGDEDNEPCPSQPELTTNEVTNINYDQNQEYFTATLSGEISNIPLGANCETLSITNQGFVYGTNIQPTIEDNVENANGQNASANIIGLISETTYYARAYLTNTLGTFYGNQVNFETSETPDFAAPVITIIGDNPLELFQYEEYEELGATAVDDIDGDITNAIEISSNVNVEVEGTYEVIYSVSDSYGNEASEVRVVEVLGNAVYLDENGVTIKANDWANIGDIGIINEIEYTVVDDALLIEIANNGGDLSKVCTTNISLFPIDITSGINGNISTFNQDISSWDVGNLNSLYKAFKYNESFNQDISYWNVSNVNDFREIFWGAKEFNQDIGDWDVSNATSMFHAFYRAFSFNGNIGSWDVSNVTDMYAMFREARDFNQPIGDWDVSNVTNMGVMFHTAYEFNQPIGDWDVGNVIYMAETFREAGVFNQPIGDWDVSNVTNMYGMFTYAWSFNQGIGDWDVSSVTDMKQMFYGMASNATTPFNQPIGDWDVSSVTDMYGMFHYSEFNQDIGDWNVSNVTDMGQMFSCNHSFNQYIGNWNVGNVTNMSGMFASCNGNVTYQFNQNLNSWDVSNVENCSAFVYNGTFGGWPHNFDQINLPNFTSCNPD